MAHLVDIKQTCTEAYCDKPAVVMVRDRRNADIRVCCRKHGEELRDRLNRSEETDG